MGAWIALTLLVIAGLALLLRADAGSIAGFDPSDFAIAVAGVALLIFLGSSIAGSYRGRAGQAVRDLLTWALVALVLVAGYSYREEILSLGHRVAGELLPPGTRLRGRAAGRRRAVGADPPPGRRAFHRQDAGQRRVAEHAGRYRRLHGGAQAGRCPAAGHRRRPAAVFGARADGQRHHLCGPRAPAQPDARAHQSSTTSTRWWPSPGALKENLLGMSFLSRLRSYEFTSDYADAAQLRQPGAACRLRAGVEVLRHGVVIGIAAGRRHGGGMGRALGCAAASAWSISARSSTRRAAVLGVPAASTAARRTVAEPSAGAGRLRPLLCGAAWSRSGRAPTATTTPTPRSTAGRSSVMVDTGASIVALSLRGCARARASTSATATITQRVSTANGVCPGRARHARSRQHRRHHRAQRAGGREEPGKLGTSLLGMSFLGRLQRVDMRGGMLVLQE